MSEFKRRLEKRAINHGMLFIKRDANIRSVAKETGISKSTVHKDLLKLKDFHPELYKLVREKLEYHKQVRHIRGGHTMQQKLLKKKAGK